MKKVVVTKDLPHKKVRKNKVYNVRFLWGLTQEVIVANDEGQAFLLKNDEYRALTRWEKFVNWFKK